MSLRIGSASSRSSRGFTLIETMIVVGIAGVLSSLAYPSFTSHIQRARRTDAMVALMQVQLAQERFRSSNPSYGSLADLGLPSSSMSGHYSLQMRSNATTAYEVVAAASGAQTHDAACRTLRLSQDSNGLVFASGSDAAASNATAINRQCWNR